MRKGVRREGRADAIVALVEVDGNRYRELPTAGADVPAPTGVVAWSKDGRSILYGIGDDTPQVRVMRLGVDGKKNEFTGLTIDRGSAERAMTHGVDFNPDGSRVVFGSGSGAIKEIWVLENILSALNRSH